MYAWEDRVVAAHDPTTISFVVAQPMVDAIWNDMGLQYPPAVEALPRQARRTVATANRLSIRLPETIPSWCLLHELAHCMTTHADGRSDGHGPIFMGVYVRLLERYLRLDGDALLGSLAEEGIRVTRYARVVFLDN